MKKLFKMALAVMMAFTLVACGGNTGGDAKTVKVGVSIYKFDDNFMTLYRNEIVDYF